MTTKYSPMLEQYFGLKEKHPDALLLMRVGDFYEAYGEEAERMARALQIALTTKDAGGGRKVAMAGVPHHALAGYLAKLVAQRHVVALAEQLEEPKPNKLVRRDVTRVITPGTIVEEHLLDGKQNNYLAAVVLCAETLALAYADISTGYCAVTALSGETAAEDLQAELTRVMPSELVLELPDPLRSQIVACVEPFSTRVTPSQVTLLEAHLRATPDGFSLEESTAMQRALDVLSAFIVRTGVAGGVAPLDAVLCYRKQAYLAIDAGARKHLELLRAQGQNPRATLFATLDACVTPMGSRLLARWISAPLLDSHQIEHRLEDVQQLSAAHGVRSALQTIFRGCFDIERIAQKVRYGRALPRDIASLRRTFETMLPLRATVPSALAHRIDELADFSDLLADIRKTLLEEPAAGLGDGGVIRPDADSELAECVALRSDSRSRLGDLEERERERTGIKSLRIKYASAFGYAIEISKAFAHQVPPDYVRKQTLTTGERYITPELKELEIAISSAQSRQQHLEERLFGELVTRVAARIDDILAASEMLATLDVLCAFAECAATRGYVRPTFIDASSVHIEDGRHPVIEAMLGAHFVPNDVSLKEDDHRFILLTGPNMGGKSTYLRQTGLLVIMAQIGSFVPAKSMTLGAVDRIFTRIGAGDDLASGQSTFYMEMAEAAQILQRCTHRSLLLVDEVGRGTGTIDGLSIAQAICEYLLGLGSRAPMVLFATHFHELCALDEHWSLVANYHITAVENTARGGAPVFSHRVQPGSYSRSFGIEVARMAGLPSSVIARAQEVALALGGKADIEVQAPLRVRATHRADDHAQLSLLGPHG